MRRRGRYALLGGSRRLLPFVKLSEAEGSWPADSTVSEVGVPFVALFTEAMLH